MTTMGKWKAPVVVAAALVLTPVTGLARPQAEIDSRGALEEAVELRAGVVRLEFAARPDVWGNGRSWHMSDDRLPNARGCSGCTNGPVRVTLRVDEGGIREVDSQVGGDWKVDGRDIGVVSPGVAADYLVGLVEAGDVDDESAEEALGAAMAADAPRPWERLLRIGDDRSQDSGVRSTAIFWVAQEAGQRAAEAIEDIAVRSDEDTEVQESAVFALTQLPDDRSTDVLLKIARENRNPDLIPTVYFWLGQSDDPRVLRHFEEVLLRN